MLLSESNQWKAYLYFTNKAKNLNENELITMLQNALHKMSVTLIIILNEVNLCQVFQWYQEKSLFGMGSLLKNPSPGESLSAGDLVRNLMLASVVSQDIGSDQLLQNSVHKFSPYFPGR